MRTTRSSAPGPANHGEARHAYVGGWAQQRGRFIALLLGVRRGRRRKLRYIGEVRTKPDDLATAMLEPRLRAGEVETSPFAEEPPHHRDHRHHWLAPELVAEISATSWNRDGVLSSASLQAVAERPSFRHPHWISPPKDAP